MMMSGRGLLALVLLSMAGLASCIQSPNLERLETACTRSPFVDKVEAKDPATLERRDAMGALWIEFRYGEIYQKLLPEAEKDDWAAQETLAFDLKMVEYERMSVPGMTSDDLRRATIYWFRRAAFHCRTDAVAGVAWYYDVGHYPVPKDTDIAACYYRAREDFGLLQTCQNMEIAAGYVK